MGFLEGLGITLGIIAVTLSSVLLYLAHRTGWNWDNFKAHWTTDGSGAKKGIVMSIVGFTLAVSVLFLFYSNNANADDLKYFNGTTVFYGLDNTMKVSPQCVQNDVDDRLTSNFGIRQNALEYKDIRIGGQYTHHSCAIGVDDHPYDAIGIMIEWTFGRK